MGGFEQFGRRPTLGVNVGLILWTLTSPIPCARRHGKRAEMSLVVSLSNYPSILGLELLINAARFTLIVAAS